MVDEEILRNKLLSFDGHIDRIDLFHAEGILHIGLIKKRQQQTDQNADRQMFQRKRYNHSW